MFRFQRAWQHRRRRGCLLRAPSCEMAVSRSSSWVRRPAFVNVSLLLETPSELYSNQSRGETPNRDPNQQCDHHIPLDLCSIIIAIFRHHHHARYRCQMFEKSNFQLCQLELLNTVLAESYQEKGIPHIGKEIPESNNGATPSPHHGKLCNIASRSQHGFRLHCKPYREF